jgi:hypothetical protein
VNWEFYFSTDEEFEADRDGGNGRERRAHIYRSTSS